MNKKKTGFTLMEILTVMAIIGLLAAMIFPTLGKVKIRARTSKAISELNTIQLALMEYYSEHSGFPTNKGTSSGLYKLYEEDYLDTAIADAFNSSQPYTYYSSDNYNGVAGMDGDTADSCIVFSIGMKETDVVISDFDGAINDAYPGLPTDLDLVPTSDNIYLFLNSGASRTDPLAGREGEIRYKQ